ncbi:MAG: alpha-galactosidase [Victivallales bacterium]|nr:alpha-galactosidase [Victivallales bacterium]
MQIHVSFNDHKCAVLDGQGECERLALPIPAATTGLCRVKFSFPLRDIQQYWTPNSEGVCNRLSWNFDVLCGAQNKFPLVVFFSRAGQNRLTFGTDDLVDDTRIHAAVNQAACTYDITIEIACCKETEIIHLMLDKRDVPWMDTLADARSELLPKSLPQFPDAAWNPVFCTWYAVHGEVDAKWVEKTAPLAKSLGFTTLIVDDGWCYHEYKRLSPETLPTWYQDIGDWNVAPEKFPDMPTHVKRIQALGMKYLVWTTAMLWGIRSRRYANHPEALTDYPVDCNCRRFDATHEEVGREIAGRLGELVAENGLDGLKVDFIDVVPNSLAHPNGRASLHLTQAISAAIRNACPQALIEFRQNYDTPQMLPYATQFRATDAPFDYILNFERAVQIRLCLGDRIPVHADPAYWAADETAENIARHMIAMLVGVPMLSMDLTSLPPTTATIIRHWLGFYNAHRAVLNLGHWEFGFADTTCAWACADDGHERIIIVSDAAHFIEPLDHTTAANTTWLLNLSTKPIPCHGETFGPDGIPAASNAIPCGGYGFFASR